MTLEELLAEMRMNERVSVVQLEPRDVKRWREALVAGVTLVADTWAHNGAAVEREACARLVESRSLGKWEQDIADAIRARGVSQVNARRPCTSPGCTYEAEPNLERCRGHEFAAVGYGCLLPTLCAR